MAIKKAAKTGFDFGVTTACGIIRAWARVNLREDDQERLEVLLDEILDQVTAADETAASGASETAN